MGKCKTCASHAIIPAIYIQSILIHPGMKSNKTLQMLQTLLLHFDFGNSYFKSLTFVGSASAWSFVFSSPPQQPMTSDFRRISIPDVIHYIVVLS